ncbi:MAG: hypothetical protein WC102_03245 [Saccharofermentanales bacterium]
MDEKLEFPITKDMWIKLRDWAIFQDKEDAGILYRETFPQSIGKTVIMDGLYNEEDDTLWMGLAYKFLDGDHVLIIYTWAISLLRTLIDRIPDPELTTYLKDIISKTDLSDYQEEIIRGRLLWY